MKWILGKVILNDAKQRQRKTKLDSGFIGEK